MNNVEETAASVRMVESDDDYRYQQDVSVGGENGQRLGAYGILASRWNELADAAGIGGATWTDRGAQDRIAREKLTRSYEALGDWTMAAVSFRYGLNIAQALTDRGATDPVSVAHAGYEDIANYMRALRDGIPQPESPVTGTLQSTKTQKTNPKRKRADDIIRKQLVGLRNAQRGVANGSDEDIEPVGDSVVSDTTE